MKEKFSAPHSESARSAVIDAAKHWYNSSIGDVTAYRKLARAIETLLKAEERPAPQTAEKP